ncbi:MAG TPA: hypothetical protein VIO34_09675 [Candidatus Dormibacteraeota bacterium]
MGFIYMVGQDDYTNDYFKGPAFNSPEPVACSAAHSAARLWRSSRSRTFSVSA